MEGRWSHMTAATQPETTTVEGTVIHETEDLALVDKTGNAGSNRDSVDSPEAPTPDEGDSESGGSEAEGDEGDTSE
jgi:hypothetical protein